MRIKICGITNLDDALLALDAGADLLGYNFFEGSPRHLPAAACARIQSTLDARGFEYTGVGVFVNSPSMEIRKVLSDCGLDMAQLHGDEPQEQLIELGTLAFKAIRPSTGQDGSRLAEGIPIRTSPPALLLDAYHPELYGGTGQRGDWALARGLAAKYDLLLAGGLTPANIFQAIEGVRPWGVDVASGVESTAGRKDAGLLQKFIAQARLAESAGEPVPEHRIQT